MDDSSAGSYLAGISLDEVRGKNALTARADALAGQVEADDVDAGYPAGGRPTSFAATAPSPGS